MNLSDVAVRRPVGTVMFFLTVAVLGAISFGRLSIRLLPDVSFPTLTVSTAYGGAGPTEVERFVTEPIERGLGRLTGLRTVTSRSREGRSRVRLRFEWGTEMDFAALHVRERLDDLRDRLPQGAGRPTILTADPSDAPVLTLAVTGADPPVLRELSENVFRRRLEQLEGVARAVVSGGPRREIRVTVDAARLAAHGLRTSDVTEALDAANYSAPGGTIRHGRFRYTVRTEGRFSSVDELRDVPVVGSAAVPRTAAATSPTAPGFVRLGELAEVRDTFGERESLTRHDGAPAVGIRVYGASGSNTIRVADRVERVLRRLRAEVPEVDLTVATDRATFVREAIAGVVQALVAGALLAFVVLFLFLGEPRYPLAVGVAIPVSVLVAFSLCLLSGVSLNVMSLGGLALGVGMLVDNSIVVLENVFRHRDEENLGPDDAAAAGTREVGPAIVASTLTTLAVFGPVLYVEGVAGRLFADLSLTVVFSLLASLLVALTLLPVLAARVARSRVGVTRRGSEAALPGRRRIRRAFDRGFAAFAGRYEGMLRWSLAHRAPVLVGAAGGLALAAVAATDLPRDLMPAVDEGRFRVHLGLPVGTPLETTAETARRLEHDLLQVPEVSGVLVRVGRAPDTGSGAAPPLSGLHRAVLEVGLARDAPPAADVARRFRRAVTRDGLDPRSVVVEAGRATSLGRALGLREADLALAVQGDRIEQLAAVAESARARLDGVPGLEDVRVDLERSQPELRVDVDRGAVARRGLTVREVGDALAASLRGVETGRPFAEFSDRIPIRVLPSTAERRRLSDVLDLPVGGAPIGELVRVERGFGPIEVRREDRKRTVRVLADAAGIGLLGAEDRVRRRLSGLSVPEGVTLRVGGRNERARESLRSLGFTLGLAAVLVYLILAGQFESVLRPLVVLVAVPLGVSGAVLALWMTGTGLDVMSGIGLVILTGIVVNDAILKVDFIDRRRRQGLGKRAAILEAGRLRLRPILMTTATTVLGLCPLALGWGAGADFRAPLAIAAIGGLVSATALTLVVIPVVYSVLIDPGIPVEWPEDTATGGASAG